MTQNTQETLLERRMKDFVAGPSWVPAAPGPSGHARPTGNRWSDSPVVKWTLDLVDRLDPGCDNRAPMRAAGSDAAAQARAAIVHGVVPALEAVRDELAADGYEVELDCAAGHASLAVTNHNGSRLGYEVTGQAYADPTFTLGDAQRNAGRQRPRIEIRSRGRLRTRAPAWCSGRAIGRDCRRELYQSLLW